MWKVLNIEVVLGEPTSFFDHLYLGVYSRTRWHKQRYCWQLQNHVWIQYFSRKASMLGKSVYFFVVLWHGRPCQEMCGTILWVGKQDDSTTLQSIISVHWRPSFQRRRVEIRGRIVKSMLSISSEMLRLGTYWKDLIFCGLWTNLHDQSQKKPKRVTNDYLVCSLTFIIHVITNNADWDCFKTPILQEILRIQNLHQVEHCTFSEAIRLCQSVGCVRNNLQFRTVQTESEIISLDAGLRMDGIPALDFWDLIVIVLHGNTNQSKQERVDSCTNLVRAAPHKLPMRKKSHGWLMI